ncbi:transcription factor Adf-1 [Elysia marginata]|uniref:Transcription factor Adf-1 n=1 Tax=Elysia marginata TaxID=1093978 RepID=A0AAV4F9G3_9GAST|nr:transcription factor Adf-1 [Elysia marginata]
MNMDCQQVEKLITAVEKRPSLYDKTCPSHSNRAYLNAEWKKIAKEVGCTELQARKRWKKLRDYFQKNHRDLGAAGFKKRKWYLYDRLLFILPYLSDKNSSDSMAILSVDNEINKDDQEGMSQTLPFVQFTDTTIPSSTLEDEANEGNDHLLNSAAPLASADSSPKFEDNARHCTPNSFSQQQPKQAEPETEKIKSTAGQAPHSHIVREERARLPETDEDEHFFKSLIPKIRLLNVIDKMECQAEIHSVVLKYLKKAKGYAS